MSTLKVARQRARVCSSWTGKPYCVVHTPSDHDVPNKYRYVCVSTELLSSDDNVVYRTDEVRE